MVRSVATSLAGRVALVAAAIVLGGCGLVGPDEGDELEDARELWQSKGISDYTYTLRRGCFCARETIGPVDITVRGGQIESLAYADDGEPVTIMPELWPTMPGLFDLIEGALQGDADDVDVAFHPDLGYPLTADIDYVEQAIDDELYLAVLGLEVLAPR